MRPEFHARREAIVAVNLALTSPLFVTELIRSSRREGEIDPREAALALEIAQGTLRHVRTLERLLSSVAGVERARVDPLVYTILLTAAYQIIWMERIPPFAAVHEAVGEASRTRDGSRAGGFVNAVLRNLLRAVETRRIEWSGLAPTTVRVSWDRACEFSRPVLPAAGDELLAAATGETVQRLRVLRKRFGTAAAEQIAWASQALPVTIVQRQRLRIDPEAFAQRMRSEFGEQVECTPNTAYLPRSGRLRASPAFRAGLCYVQDVTAAAAVEAVGARPGERILDLCAAPGGKTVGLAIAMEDRGQVVATDSDVQRLRRVTQNVLRLGLESVEIVPPGSPLLGRFDAALADVPCSNSGVAARRPEARLRFSARELRFLVPLQAKCLELAAHLVRPGGRVVYSTCSIEPEENEEQVREFLAANPGWELELEKLTLPDWGPRLIEWRDGGYFARLRRLR